jgi:hypothetical protein
MLFLMPDEAPAVAGQVLLPAALNHDKRARALAEANRQAAAKLQAASVPFSAVAAVPAYAASRRLVARTLRLSYGLGAGLGCALLGLAAPLLPAAFALDAAATASLAPLLPVAAWLMPLVGEVCSPTPRHWPETKGLGPFSRSNAGSSHGWNLNS